MVRQRWKIAIHALVPTESGPVLQCSVLARNLNAKMGTRRWKNATLALAMAVFGPALS